MSALLNIAPPVALVRQDDPWGCMVASLAMVLGRTYEETKALLHPWHFRPENAATGIGAKEMDALLTEHGYAVARRYEHYHPACCQRSAWPPKPWADVHIAEVQTSQGHAVVMRKDGLVLDPWYGDAIHSLHEYERVYWVAAIYRIGDPLPEFVGPDSPDRKPPTVCACRGAWNP